MLLWLIIAFSSIWLVMEWESNTLAVTDFKPYFDCSLVRTLDNRLIQCFHFKFLLKCSDDQIRDEPKHIFSVQTMLHEMEINMSIILKCNKQPQNIQTGKRQAASVKVIVCLLFRLVHLPPLRPPWWLEAAPSFVWVALSVLMGYCV